jgi:hypothetical protein
MRLSRVVRSVCSWRVSRFVALAPEPTDQDRGRRNPVVLTDPLFKLDKIIRQKELDFSLVQPLADDKGFWTGEAKRHYFCASLGILMIRLI